MANHAVDVLKERNMNLEFQLEERNKDYQTAMEANRRMQSEMKQVNHSQVIYNKKLLQNFYKLTGSYANFPELFVNLYYIQRSKKNVIH